MILVFVDEHSHSLLQDFAKQYSRYRDEGAEVLAVVADHPGADFPFPVLIDSRDQIISRLTDRLPTILILDSYNELHARLEGPWEDGQGLRADLEKLEETSITKLVENLKKQGVSEEMIARAIEDLEQE